MKPILILSLAAKTLLGSCSNKKHHRSSHSDDEKTEQENGFTPNNKSDS